MSNKGRREPYFEKTAEESLPRKSVMLPAIGERLRWARKRNGMTQEEAASRVSVHWDEKRYSRYETGKNEMKVIALREICMVLGCSADELLFGEDREARSYPPGYRELTEENRATVDALTAVLLGSQRRE